MAKGKSRVPNAALRAEKALHTCSPRCNRPPRANPNPERAEVRHTAFTGCLRPYRGQVRFTVTTPCSQLNGYPPRPVNAYSPRNGGGPRWGLPGPARGAGGRGVQCPARTGDGQSAQRAAAEVPPAARARARRATSAGVRRGPLRVRGARQGRGLRHATAGPHRGSPALRPPQDEGRDPRKPSLTQRGMGTLPLSHFRSPACGIIRGSGAAVAHARTMLPQVARVE